MSHAKPRYRRTHSAQLKAEVLAACGEPGASVAAIALAHRLNTNLVHKWRRQAARTKNVPTVRRTSGVLPSTSGAEFVALPVASAEMRVEIRRGATNVAVHWPASAAEACAAWLGTRLR